MFKLYEVIIVMLNFMFMQEVLIALLMRLQVFLINILKKRNLMCFLYARK